MSSFSGKHLLLFFFLSGLFKPSFLLACAPDSLITLFPEKHLVHEFIADGSAHRFSIAKAFQGSHIHASVGGTLPLLESRILGTRMQLSLGASVSTQLHPQQNIAVISTEFYLDYLLIDIQWTPNLFSRLGMGHTSHHLGDNALTLLQGRMPIDFSRDYIKGFLGYMDDGTRIYAGADYGYGFVIEHPVSKHWLIQAGLEKTMVRFGEGLQVFGAIDIKFRQEDAFGSTQRFQTGIEFRNGTERLFRLALTHQTGLEERGQFHGERTIITTLGIVIEL